MQSTDPPSPAPAVPRSAVPVGPGDLIGDKYRVERFVGAGGVGVVLHATHLALGEGVAIKLLQRSSQSDENLVRFEREARALARIKSEHVARIRDTGALPSGEPYLVMDLLEGEDFGALIKREGRLEIERAVDYLMQAADAVVQAHARGIVHRDLKPANLFLTKDADGGDLVKVLDFGISKLKFEAGVEAQRVTQTLSVIGSPLYMSPEQMEAPRDADEASDVWSLAVILHELITGKPPFEAPTLPLLLARICTSPPTRLTEARPGAPEALDALIARALEKDKANRPPSVAAFAVALAPFASRAGRAMVDRIVRIAETEKMPLDPEIGPDSGVRRWSWSSSPPPAADGPASEVPVASRPPVARSHGQFKLAIGAMAIGLVGVLAGAAWGKRSATPIAPMVAGRPLAALSIEGERLAAVERPASADLEAKAASAALADAASEAAEPATSAAGIDPTSLGDVGAPSASAAVSAPPVRGTAAPARALAGGRGASRGGPYGGPKSDVFSER